VSVTTRVAEQRDVPVVLRTTGTVTALNSVDIRPQVSSTVRQVHFKEGQYVRAGQLLFTLDTPADEANVAKARAQLQKDMASQADAQRQLERAQQLLSQNFVSKGAVDTAQAQKESWDASVAADRAALKAADVQLAYARINAPSAGRAGAVAVYPGSLVVANQTLLVTLTQIDPIGVGFALPQRQLPQALGALGQGGAPVQVKLPDNPALFNGHLQFVDNAVDAASGTVRVKAVLPNPKQELWPGAFVEVSQTVDTLHGAVVVPQEAVIESIKGPLVYSVVDDKAQPRPVKVLFADLGLAAVSGVQAGEVVVVDGRQNLRPGAAVVVRVPGADKKPAADKAAPAAGAGKKADGT
jgi:RND family efflux transporter MFP subunit